MTMGLARMSCTALLFQIAPMRTTATASESAGKNRKSSGTPPSGAWEGGLGLSGAVFAAVGWPPGFGPPKLGRPGFWPPKPGAPVLGLGCPPPWFGPPNPAPGGMGPPPGPAPGGIGPPGIPAGGTASGAATPLASELSATAGASRAQPPHSAGALSRSLRGSVTLTGNHRLRSVERRVSGWWVYIPS